MSSNPVKYHPPSLQTPEISIYFICRIESSYPNERIEFVTNFCKRFRHRIDQHVQFLDDNNHDKPPTHNANNHLESKAKRRFVTDEDVFEVVEHSPFHEILVLFGPYIVHNRFMCPIMAVSQAFADLISHINQVKTMHGEISRSNTRNFQFLPCVFCAVFLYFYCFCITAAYIQYILIGYPHTQKLNVSIPCQSPPYPLSGFLELSWVQYPFECEQNENESTQQTDNSDYDENEEIEEENLSSHHKQFSVFGRITHLCLLLQSHKSYLSDFLSLFHAAMYDDNGPLAHEQRQYLGLMAASRFSCKALIEQCELQYHKMNGDMTWIKSGIKSAPQKYQKMAKINAILAHQPWLIEKQHIAELVDGNGAWSISECVQAFVILVTYHFMCGLYQGLCITPEIDNYFALTLQSTMQSLATTLQQDEKPRNVIDNILSPMLSMPQAVPHDDIDDRDEEEEEEEEEEDELEQVSHDLDELQLTDSMDRHNEEEEDQRSQTIAKLLSHTQEHLVEDEDIVGAAKKAFEEAACLHLELGSLQENTMYDNPEAARSCFIKFRQLSDLTDDDDTNDDAVDMNGMEFDPDMAPPPSLATSTSKEKEKEKMQPIHEESKEEQSNGDAESAVNKMMGQLDHVSSIPTKQPNELTAADWKQLISLREQNMMFATKSVNSNADEKDNNSSKASTVTDENVLWQTNDQKLATLTNPAKPKKTAMINGQQTNNNGKKLSGKKKRQIMKRDRHKYRKIIAPKSQGNLYWKYSLGIDMVYEDFDCHGNHQMHAYDFNWDKHGYACLSRYYPGIEKKMDAVFKTAYTMTDHSINNADNVDTEPFRIAIWHYTFRLFGVNNDSYEYRFVNVYLPVKLKIFIKKLVCYPQIVTIEDIKKMGVALKEHEKIHVALLALEAKKQAALLFALKAIMKYMQSN